MILKKGSKKEGAITQIVSELLDFYIVAKYSPSKVPQPEVRLFINNINKLKTKKGVFLKKFRFLKTSIKIEGGQLNQET